VKIADGGHRAAGPALLHARAQVDALDGRQLTAMADRLRPAVLGGGAPVGMIEPAFVLHRR
jgi:hypothetical protein